MNRIPRAQHPLGKVLRIGVRAIWSLDKIHNCVWLWLDCFFFLLRLRLVSLLLFSFILCIYFPVRVFVCCYLIFFFCFVYFGVCEPDHCMQMRSSKCLLCIIVIPFWWWLFLIWYNSSLVCCRSPINHCVNTYNIFFRSLVVCLLLLLLFSNPFDFIYVNRENA